MIDGRRLAAIGVHGFTALGAVLGFKALLEAAAHHWEAAFAWLGVALIVDGVDGPLARRIGVTDHLPRFSGERLDLIIDYITYVLVPAFILYEAQLMPEGLGWLGASLALLSSLFHFSDRESKTSDGFFVGFPAIWNVVAFYMLIFATPAILNLGIVAALAAITFIPLKWVHPVRVVRLRSVTIAVIAVWSLASIAVLFTGFPAPFPMQVIFAAVMVYLIAVGLLRKAAHDGAPSPHSKSDAG